MTTRVLLVDDHPVVRRGVRATIEVDETITVAGEAGSGEQALALLAEVELAVDVVLLDLQLGAGIDGAETTRRIQRLPRPPRVLVLTGQRSGDDRCRARVPREKFHDHHRRARCPDGEQPLTHSEAYLGDTGDEHEVGGHPGPGAESRWAGHCGHQAAGDDAAETNSDESLHRVPPHPPILGGEPLWAHVQVPDSGSAITVTRCPGGLASNAPTRRHGGLPDLGRRGTQRAVEGRLAASRWRPTRVEGHRSFSRGDHRSGRLPTGPRFDHSDNRPGPGHGWWVRPGRAGTDR